VTVIQLSNNNLTTSSRSRYI